MPQCIVGNGHMGTYEQNDRLTHVKTLPCCSFVLHFSWNCILLLDQSLNVPVTTIRLTNVNAITESDEDESSARRRKRRKLQHKGQFVASITLKATGKYLSKI